MPNAFPNLRLTSLFVVTAAWLGGLAHIGCVNEVGTDCTDGSCDAGPAAECMIDSDCGAGICVDGVCDTGLVFEPEPTAEPAPGPEVPAGDGQVAILPGTEVDFGSPLLNASVDQVLQVQNTGTGAFALERIFFGDDTSDEFSYTTEPALPVTLEPQDTFEVTLHYALADGESDVGQAFLVTDAAGCTFECDPTAIAIDLLSEFKGARNLDVTPETHDFGYVPAGEESTAVSVLITNDGTIDKVLTVHSLEATGDVDAFDFTLPSVPLFLTPGQSIEIPVVYTPDVIADAEALVITAQANSDAPENVEKAATLTATSQPPNALVFDPPQLVFADGMVGSTQRLSSTLKNIGASPIEVSMLRVGQQVPVEYTVQTVQTLPYTLLPNEEIDVFVDFTPQLNQASSNVVHAINDQPSGLAPTLNLQGAGYIPPGGPNLEVVMGPETIIDEGCFCQAGVGVPTANVDLSYRSVTTGQTCGKPADPSCGVDGTCACPAMGSYGQLAWGSARTEQVRGQTWIIDEKVTHEGSGANGTFAVRADLVDDCLAVPGSLSRAVNFACIELDCNTAWNANATQSCFDYGEYPICAMEADYYSAVMGSQDCLQRGPVAIKTRVRIYGGENPEQVREFCTTLGSSGQTRDVVQLERNAGYFTFGSVQPGIQEVTPGTPCE